MKCCVTAIKRISAYDENHNPIELIDQIWDNNSWQNTFKYFYSYNEFNFIDEAYCEIWNNGQWVPGDGYIFFDYSDKFKVFFETSRLTAYYSVLTSVNEIHYPNSMKYELYQNYPNPFNPTTTIQYTVANDEYVRLQVYNLLGQEIETLVNEYKKAGTYQVNFNSNSSSGGLPSGVYFYTLHTKNKTLSRKMLIMK